EWGFPPRRPESEPNTHPGYTETRADRQQNDLGWLTRRARFSERRLLPAERVRAGPRPSAPPAERPPSPFDWPYRPPVDSPSRPLVALAGSQAGTLPVPAGLRTRLPLVAGAPAHRDKTQPPPAVPTPRQRP